jgi:branched-chain amino acid aminotransferase/4-amino-4-deoxychorismate lyase
MEIKAEFFWNNGWTNPESLKMSENRSFLFGDGFFETMRFYSDQLTELWPFHWDRLQRSICVLQFSWPEEFTEAFFVNEIRARLPRHSHQDIRVKLLFFRTGEGRYTPENCGLAFLLSIEYCTHPWVQTISQIAKSETVFLGKHTFSWIKTTSAQLYVMASLERHQRNLDDLLLCDEDGNVIEGCYSSICWQKDGSLFFPSRDLGGFDSCHRRFLESYWTKTGRLFEETIQKAEEVLAADWICFGGATGIRIWIKDGVPFPSAEFALYPPRPMDYPPLL